MDPHRAGCLDKEQRGSSNDAESTLFNFTGDRVLYTGALIEEGVGGTRPGYCAADAVAIDDGREGTLANKPEAAVHTCVGWMLQMQTCVRAQLVAFCVISQQKSRFSSTNIDFRTFFVPEVGTPH